MKLYHEILAHYLAQQDAHILFPNLVLDAGAIVELNCLQVIKEIQSILADDQLDDPECFKRIEAIVSVLEDHGVNCGSRHDFG